MGSVLQKCCRLIRPREEVIIEQAAILNVLEGICEDMHDIEDINTLKSTIRLCYKLHLMKFNKAVNTHSPYYLS